MTMWVTAVGDTTVISERVTPESKGKELLFQHHGQLSNSLVPCTA